MNQPPNVQHHHCLTGAAWCSGLNPCPRCFDHVRTRVLLAAIMRAGLNQPNSPYLQLLIEGYHLGWAQLQQELGVDPTLRQSVVTTPVQSVVFEPPQAYPQPQYIPPQPSWPTPPQQLQPQVPPPVYGPPAVYGPPPGFVAPQAPPAYPPQVAYGPPPMMRQPGYAAAPAYSDDPDTAALLRAAHEEAQRQKQAQLRGQVPTTLNAAEAEVEEALAVPVSPPGAVLPRADDRVERLAAPVAPTTAEDIARAAAPGVALGSVMAPGFVPAVKRGAPPSPSEEIQNGAATTEKGEP